MTKDVSGWINGVDNDRFVWYVKRLSGNDTLANGSHQAGPYIPNSLFFRIFPSLKCDHDRNPETRIDLVIDSHTDRRKARAIWYNNKLSGGTRNESRLTNLGGIKSPLLDPENTGGLVVFAFLLGGDGGDSRECHVWVCRNESEEEIIEERIGLVEPGKFKIWPLSLAAAILKSKLPHARTSCWLKSEEIPPEWLKHFPSASEIVMKTVGFKRAMGFVADDRLMMRRDCEYEIFKSVEEAVELPLIREGFCSINEFIAKAQTVLQRRKARAGRSLELHTKMIFVEEGLNEGQDFSHQPESDLGKSPDFLFPSEKKYKNAEFPQSKLRMLAVKTTCKDRWRQILNEADRIPVKHLLTLQEGISESQFREMTNANVQLVVPQRIIPFYPKAVRPHVQNLRDFIGELKLLRE